MQPLRSLPQALALIAMAALPSPAQAPLYDIRGQSGDWLGQGLGALGDCDGDGFPEIGLGAPYGNGPLGNEGRVEVRSGRIGWPVHVLYGQSSGDRFGHSISSTSDTNGDGVDEIIVGAPGRDGGLGPEQGWVYLISGASGATIWKLGGNAAGDRGGWAVAGLGDVDGDGAGDYAWSLPWHDVFGSNAGRVWVTSGATHQVIRAHSGEAAGDFFGWSLDAAGDADGDGVTDLIVGAPGHDANGSHSGKAYVYSGATGALLYAITGTLIQAQLGNAVAGLGDLDGDGLSDVAVGEPYANLGSAHQGRVLVISSAPAHPVLWSVVGAPGSATGYSLDGLGDVDGDGIGDLIAGSPIEDPFGLEDRGAARVRSGATGAVLYTSYGSLNGDMMGLSVAAAGDLNADGAADFVTGAPRSDGNGTDSGWAHIVLSSAPSPVPYCTAKTNSAGCIPAIGYTGCPSVSVGDNFNVHAVDILRSVPGFLMWSYSPAAIPFGGGTLCIGAPRRRTPVQFSGGIPSDPCSGNFYRPFTHADFAAAAASPGAQLYFQYYSRDNGFPSPQNVNLTNALSVTVLP